MSIKMSIAHATLGRPYGFPVKLAGFRMAYHSKRRRLKWIFSATRILRSSQLSGVNKNNRPPVSWELEGERQRESERWKESDRRWWHVLQKLAALRGVYVLRWRRGHFPLFFTVFFPLLPLLPLMCFENAYPNPARCTVTAGQWQRAKQKPNSSSVSPRSWSERVAGREPFRWGWQHQHGRAPTQLQRDSGR